MGVNLSNVEALLFVPLTQCLHPKPYTLSTTALLDRRVCCSSENVPTLTLTLTLMQPFDFGRQKSVLWITKGLWNKHHIFVLKSFKAGYTSIFCVCVFMIVCVCACVCLPCVHRDQKGASDPQSQSYVHMWVLGAPGSSSRQQTLNRCVLSSPVASNPPFENLLSWPPTLSVCSCQTQLQLYLNV